MMWTGKRVVVMGLGLFGGGVGAARYLAKRGAEVVVTDLRGAEALRPSIEALAGLPLRTAFGGHRDEDFRAADLIVVNPGVPDDSPFLDVARRRGAALDTEIGLFLRACPCRTAAVTGTNGKSTTTRLLGDLLAASGVRTWVGGNLGGSLLDRVEEMAADDAAVIEISSFQLERLARSWDSGGSARWRPDVAVVTTFSDNHLDRHGTLEAYARAKQEIARGQTERDVKVLPHDDPALWGWRSVGAGRLRSFGEGPCPGAGVSLDGEGLRRGGERLDLAGRRLPGRFNLRNMAAALAAADAFGPRPLPAAQAESLLREFPGLEHRLEHVGTWNGIAFYNDSIATNPESTRAALEALGRPVVLVAGGSDKGMEFGVLAPAFRSAVRAAFLTGPTAPALAKVADDAGVPHRTFATLREATAAAVAAARPGDRLCLSPASASFDQFSNFTERGRLFKQWVRAL